MIGIDLDSVVCELIPSVLDRINQQYSTKYRPEHVDRWYWEDAGRGIRLGAEVGAFFRDRQAMLKLPAVTGAVKAVDGMISDGMPVSIVTARSAHHAKVTQRWLYEQFGYVPPTIHTKEKWNVQGLDILVDDRLDMILDFADDGRVGILFDQPWNRFMDGKPALLPSQAFRVRGWKECDDLVRRIYANRKASR